MQRTLSDGILVVLFVSCKATPRSSYSPPAHRRSLAANEAHHRGRGAHLLLANPQTNKAGYVIFQCETVPWSEKARALVQGSSARAGRVVFVTREQYS